MKGFKDSNSNKKNNIIKPLIKNNLDEAYKRAIYLQKAGETNQASKIYDYLIKNNYKKEEVFLNYANICQQSNNNDKAIALYKESLKINSNNFIPFFKMGFI